MDQRIDMLERDVSEIKTEIAVIRCDYSQREESRELEGRLAAVEGRLDAIESRMNALEGRLAALEGRISSLEGRFSALEVRFGVLEVRFSALEGRIDHIEQELLRLRIDIAKIFELLSQHGARLVAIETGIVQLQDKFVTKLELAKLEARVKTWAITCVLATVTAITSIQLAIATLIR